jgi:uncharacterized protein YjiS (DUF1127 family)
MSLTLAVPRLRRYRLRLPLRAFLAWVQAVRQDARTRRELGAMDARMLADIGVSTATAAHEANRRPWDVSAPR